MTQHKAHSFQAGDRVIAKELAGQGTKGEKGYLFEGIQGTRKFIGIKFDKGWLNGGNGFYSTHHSWADNFSEKYDHDTDIQPGDWVRHESVNTFDIDLDRKKLHLDPKDTFDKLGPRGIINSIPTDEESSHLVYKENCVKIQPTSKETSMEQSTSQTPLEQWKQVYYPIPAREMQSKSDLECLDHAIQKWRGFHADVIEEYGVERSKLPTDDTSCSLCTKYYDSGKECPKCPLVLYGSGSCLEDGSIYVNSQPKYKHKNPEMMLNELIQVKKKVRDEANKPKPPQFYVNGHGPYEQVAVSEGGYHILQLDQSGLFRHTDIEYANVEDTNGRVTLRNGND